MTYCLPIGIFTIVPTTQYVWINQTATFECATSDSSYSLDFSIPGVPFIPSGDVNSMITASFTVTADNNGTGVRCQADDGDDFQRTERVYAYAQGIG